jgi:hypothetical protein
VLAGREGHGRGAAQQVNLEPGVAPAVAQQDHCRGVPGLGHGEPAVRESTGSLEKVLGYRVHGMIVGSWGGATGK